MMKWVTGFIEQNEEQWKTEREEKELVAMQEIYEWERANRLEKRR